MTSASTPQATLSFVKFSGTTAMRKKSTQQWCSSGCVVTIQRWMNICALTFSPKRRCWISSTKRNPVTPKMRAARARSTSAACANNGSETMNDLLREQAPISAAAWKEIDAEAARTLKVLLAARRLVDFSGPLGWSTSAVSTGRTEKLGQSLQDGIASRLRVVQPLVEIRIPFEVQREELEAIGRGATDADLDVVRNAARAAAIAEDRAIFQGYPAAGIQGIFEA